MSRKIEREIEFTDWWFKEHKKAPTYADAIKWAEKEMIEKACEWVGDNLKNYAFVDSDIIKDFRKTMEKMKARLKHKMLTNMYNPKMHYSINQILIATKGLFLTPLHMPNGCRYYMSHYCGKITKFDKEGTK